MMSYSNVWTNCESRTFPTRDLVDSVKWVLFQAFCQWSITKKVDITRARAGICGIMFTMVYPVIPCRARASRTKGACLSLIYRWNSSSFIAGFLKAHTVHTSIVF